MLDGSDARPLTIGAAFDERPAFSPDGQQIAFISDRRGARAIWTIGRDGGAARKIVDAVVWGCDEVTPDLGGKVARLMNRLAPDLMTLGARLLLPDPKIRK